MIEPFKVFICIGDTAKDFTIDGKLVISENQLCQEFMRRENTIYYVLKWWILFKKLDLMFFISHSILKKPFDDEVSIT